MALLLKHIVSGYLRLQELQDPRTSDVLLLNPFVLFPILGVYIYFVFNWGPRFMKNRQPFNIQNIIKIYNLIQVIINVLLILYTIKAFTQQNLFCRGANFTQDPLDILQLNIGLSYYYTKLIDLLDTVFFILRKRFRQASFLHIYHHIAMSMFGFIGCKWQSGGHAGYHILINSFVHVIMYFYYFLTATESFRDQATKWKKFVTQIQLVQHCLLFLVFGYPLLDFQCEFPKFLCYLMVPQCLFMVLLFGEFYLKTYVFKTKI